MARVLVAEDDAGVRILVSRALALEGHEVRVAEDGLEALEILIETNGAFDLILSDIRMPAMTGIELAHEVAASWPDLPVLLMTGYAEQKEAAESLTAIIKGVVEKPFTLATIRNRVSDVLNLHAAPARAADLVVLDRAAPGEIVPALRRYA